MTSLEGNTSRKKTRSSSRGKTEIKKVEQLNKRYVTFSKRKLGLFNKVTELSILCQAETALIITSPNDKLYACGYPSPDTVIQRFLNRGPPPPSAANNKIKREQEETIEGLRLQYEAIQDQLKEEKKNLAMMETQNSSTNSCFPSWWNLSIENMDLECLQHFKQSMENLRLNVIVAMQEKRLRFNPLPPEPLLIAPPVPPVFPNRSLFSGQQQVHDSWKSVCSGSGTSGMVPSFGHY
ncbi:hypothetical protein SESBI_28767 [Sesbania bispinosa]|nr:hypothetical protein SESBI_28767 [Sesbania bispinosa]